MGKQYTLERDKNMNQLTRRLSRYLERLDLRHWWATSISQSWDRNRDRGWLTLSLKAFLAADLSKVD